MAKILTFTVPLNVSVQPGDMIYYCTTDPGDTISPQAGRNLVSSYNTKPVKYGYVVAVDHTLMKVTVNNIPGVPDPTEEQYIFFSKDRRVNHSGIIGYYAETEYKNDSSLQTEIFATAVDYVESSK